MSLILKGEVLALYKELNRQGYNLFNPDDDFYNNICTPYTSPNGTDLTISGRKKYYYDVFGIVCQDNCKFSDYSLENELLQCDCNTIVENIEPKKENKFNPKILYKSFYDILKYSNYKVLKCYELVFKKNSIINKGSIVVIIYFSFYLAFLFIYIVKGTSYLKDVYSRFQNLSSCNLNNMALSSKKLFDIKEKGNIKNEFGNMKKENQNEIKEDNNDKKENQDEIKENNNNKKENQNEIKENNNNKKENQDVIKENINVKKEFNNDKRKNNIFGIVHNKKTIKTRKMVKMNNNPPKKKDSNTINLEQKKVKKRLSLRKDINKLKSNNNISSQSSYWKSLENKNMQDENNISIYNSKDNKTKNDNYEYSNYELNNLEYEDSLKFDSRTFPQIYWSILKREHLILFTFFSNNDYNIKSVKLTRFIFLACTDMAMNVFFFTDDSMDKIFLSYGKYNFIQRIPQMVYSIIISQLLEIFLCFLSLTDKYIYHLKKTEYKSLTYMKKIFRIIERKIVIFFVLTFILFVCYWYIISAFCIVYKNTQLIFIKDSIISFITGLAYPFILYLFPSLLRIICLKYKNTNLKFVYTLSDIIPIF